jgi:hypothetical protein
MSRRVCRAAGSVAGYLWAPDGDSLGTAVHTCADPVECVRAAVAGPGYSRWPGSEPYPPGAEIRWTQLYGDRPAVERTGTVWEFAPLCAGVRRAYWVLPDAPEYTDGYTAIYVGVASRAHDAHGMFGQHAHGWVRKGQTHSSTVPSSNTGAMTHAAASAAARTREANAR